jgi:hypothetical protein
LISILDFYAVAFIVNGYHIINIDIFGVLRVIVHLLSIMVIQLISQLVDFGLEHYVARVAGIRPD